MSIRNLFKYVRTKDENLNKALQSAKDQFDTITRAVNTGTDPAAHILVGPKHTGSGLTAGHFLKAASPTTFGFAAHGLGAADVGAPPTARAISTTTPLAGGGDLSADRILSLGGLSSIGSPDRLVKVNHAGTAWEYQSKAAVDVRDYGADPGESPANNYAAFQGAIEAASTGGAIVFPIGNYGINDELVPYSGQSFLGFGNQPFDGTHNSSRIYQTVDGKHIFSIGELKQDIYICSLHLGARATQTGVPYTGRYGIHCHGSDPNSSHRLYLSRVTFTDFDRAINVEDPTGTDYGWAFDHVSVRDCLFALNNIGAYFKARNAAAWHFDTCNFIVPTNGSGVELNHVGFVKLTNCIAGGFSINNNTFVKIRGPYGTIIFDICQAETLYAWLDVVADAQPSKQHPIILNGCLVDADIYLREECHFMSRGTRYAKNVYIDHSDIWIDSIGDHFFTESPYFANWRIRVDPATVYFQNRLGFHQDVANSPGNILAGRREVCGPAAPTTGTWRQRDTCWNETPPAGGIPGWICIASGTFSAATDSTGDTDGSTAVITGMADTSDFEIGDYVMVSAGFFTTGPYCIINKTASSITINSNSTSAQSNITVSTPDPVFKAMALLAA